MYFLIDYENVHNAGMRGSEYLLSTDCVLLFYSAAAPTMEQRHLDNIQNSRCGFEIIKLLKAQKNALDFYIATKLGELFGAERCKNAVIISNDAGFQSVRDFWHDRSPVKHRVGLSADIEQGILTLNESSERARRIQACRKVTDIGQFYAAYQANLKMQQALRDMFEGTSYADRLEEIQSVLLAGKKSPRVLYLDSLKHFGRKEGQEVYRILKNSANL